MVRPVDYWVHHVFSLARLKDSSFSRWTSVSKILPGGLILKILHNFSDPTTPHHIQKKSKLRVEALDSWIKGLSPVSKEPFTWPNFIRMASIDHTIPQCGITTPHHTTPYHTAPYHTIPHHTILYQEPPCKALPCLKLTHKSIASG